MRLATVSVEGVERIAAVINEEYIDLNKAYELMLKSQGQYRVKEIAEAFIPPNMVGFLQGGEESMKLAKESIEFVQSHDFSEQDKRNLYYKGQNVK